MTVTEDELAQRRGVQTDDAADDTPEQDEPDGETPDAPAAEAEVEQRPPKPMQIPIPGTVEGISSNPGGSSPTSSEARILGGSLPIDGEFEGEEYVELVVTAKVGEVDFIYTYDDWGNTKNVKRRHKFRMISVRRA